MNKEPIFAGEEVLQLIPQRTPIVMLDAFYFGTDTEAHTGFTVPEKGLFCSEGTFSEAGLIEHIAQSASALAGYSAFLKKEPAPVGFIGEVKKLRIFKIPGIGEKLCTSIQILSEVMGITLITAETKAGDQIVASGQMKICIQSEPTQ